MKKLFLLSITAFLTTQVVAQNANLYGIVRKNYYSNVFDTLSGVFYEQFDSCTIRLGSLNPVTGQVTNIGNNVYNRSINLTGASLNPYDSTFIFIGNTDLITLNLNTGAIVTNEPLTNPLGYSYFDNFRFNNSDSTIYGLARRSTYNEITDETTSEMYLAKINTTTGVITQISPQSVGAGYAMAGSTIDPYQMVFYYSTGANIVGLDLYNGSIYSNVPIQNPYGVIFDNFAYSCVDTAVYGLIRQSYYSTVYDSTLGFEYEVFDSSTVKLGKIDPTTGQVTLISPSTVSQGGYSLNAGAVVDPNTMAYYYNNGSHLVGVSIVTGLPISFQSLSFEDGQYLDLMRNYTNCYDSYAKRRPTLTNTPEQLANNSFSLFPNPATNRLHINGDNAIKSLELISVDGKTINIALANNINPLVDIDYLVPGLYVARIMDINNKVAIKKFVKQ